MLRKGFKKARDSYVTARPLKHLEVLSLNVAILISALLIDALLGMGLRLFTTSISLSLPFILATLYRYFRYRQMIRSQVVVPEYNLPKELKIYGVGACYHGNIGDDTLLATLAYYRLNKMIPMNKLEGELSNAIKRFSLSQVYIIMFRDWHVKNRRKEYRAFSIQLTRIMFRDLIGQGLFVFNPRPWEALAGSCSALILALMFLNRGNGGLDFIPPIATNWIAYAFALLCALIALYLHLFTQNYQTTGKYVKDIHGYKMFLENTEYYRIEHDKELYEQALPIMITLGIHRNKLKEMLNYIQKKPFPK